MAINTIKTTLGFLKTLIERYAPVEFGSASLDDIFNYLPINDRISTSGQPTEKQFELVKSHGFENVINLAPGGGENSLKDEAGTLSNLGINYVHIPVDFARPGDDDFEKFKNEMQRLSEEKVWVHCAANMRVSAFIYRYRCTVLEEQPDEAKKALSKIWEPLGVWKRFIS